jgi:WD40 repeat protein
VSPDGRFLALAHPDATASLHQLPSGEPHRRLTAGGRGVDVACVAFSPSGAILATGAESLSEFE